MSLLTKRAADSEPEKAPQEKKHKAPVPIKDGVVTVVDGVVTYKGLSIKLTDTAPRPIAACFDIMTIGPWQAMVLQDKGFGDFLEYMAQLVYLQKHATHFTSVLWPGREKRYDEETDEEYKARLDAQVERVVQVDINSWGPHYGLPNVVIVTDQGRKYSPDCRWHPFVGLPRLIWEGEPDQDLPLQESRVINLKSDAAFKAGFKALMRC